MLHVYPVMEIPGTFFNDLYPVFPVSLDQGFLTIHFPVSNAHIYFFLIFSKPYINPFGHLLIDSKLTLADLKDIGRKLLYHGH